MLSIFATRAEARAWKDRMNVGRPKHEKLGTPQRPLKPKTQARIAGGFYKHVLAAAEPYIVTIENYGWNTGASRSVSEPLSTITARPKGGKHVAVDVELATYGTVCQHGGEDLRDSDLRGPMNTITGANEARGIVAASVVRFNTEKGGESARGQSVDQPISTLDTQNRFAAMAVSLVRCAHGDASADGRKRWGTTDQGADEPLPTVTASNDHAVMAVSVVKNYTGVIGQAADQPIGTVTGVDHHTLMAAHVVKFRGDSTGHPVDGPAPTITSGAGAARDAGAAHALGVAGAEVAPFRFSTDHTKTTGRGRYHDSVEEPLKTVTATNGHSLAAVYLSRLYGTNKGTNGDAGKPVGAIGAQGGHTSVNLVFLSPYYGEGSGLTGHGVNEPSPTVVGRDRFALVAADAMPPTPGTPGTPGGGWYLTPQQLKTARKVAVWAKKQLGAKVRPYLVRVVHAGSVIELVGCPVRGQDGTSGEWYLVTDILIRMFRPRELARCQGFPDDYVIDRTADGKPVTRADQVKLIGNSVPPDFLEAIVKANIVDQGLLEMSPWDPSFGVDPMRLGALPNADLRLPIAAGGAE